MEGRRGSQEGRPGWLGRHGQKDDGSKMIAVEANRCSGHVNPDSGHIAHGPCESSRSGAASVKMADLVVSVMTEVGARPCHPDSDLSAQRRFNQRRSEV